MLKPYSEGRLDNLSSKYPQSAVCNDSILSQLEDRSKAIDEQPIILGRQNWLLSNFGKGDGVVVFSSTTKWRTLCLVSTLTGPYKSENNLCTIHWKWHESFRLIKLPACTMTAVMECAEKYCFFPVNSRMSQYLRDMQDQLTILSQKLNGERLAEKRKVFPQKCMKSGFKSLRHSRTIISGRPWIFMMEQKRKVNQLHWHELCMGVGLPEKYLNLHVTNVYHRHNYFIWLSLLLSCLSLLCFCALVVWCYMITLTTNVVTSSVNWTQYKGHFINHR